MAGRTANRILQWLETRCAARQLRAGSRRREQLLRRVGRASLVACGHRLPSGGWKAHGEAAYRRFKWEQAEVPAAVQVLCRQLVLLEASLSRLARQLGSRPRAASASPHLAPPSRPAFFADGMA